MRTSKQMVALLAAGLLAGPMAANAAMVNFNFSFQNVAGNTAGTVTGRILGLMDNQPGSATSVLIDSFPATLGSLSSVADVVDWLAVYSNSFTVSNGQLISVAFVAQDGAGGTFSLDGGGVCVISGCFSQFLTFDDAANFVASNAGVTYTPAPVPLPAAAWLLLSGLAGLGFIGRRKAA